MLFWLQPVLQVCRDKLVILVISFVLGAVAFHIAAVLFGAHVLRYGTPFSGPDFVSLFSALHAIINKFL